LFLLSKRTAFAYKGKKEVTAHHPDGRRVTLSFHHSSDTFRRGTLHSIIEIQARWSMDDVTRLGLVG
jgi:hypothetical protein